MKKYWKTTITFEVLTVGEEPLPDDMTLADIVDLTVNGHASGDVTGFESREITAKDMAKELESQRSDPAFLLGDDYDLRFEYEEASGNQVDPDDNIIDSSGRLLGKYSREFAEEYLEK